MRVFRSPRARRPFGGKRMGVTLADEAVTLVPTVGCMEWDEHGPSIGNLPFSLLTDCSKSTILFLDFLSNDIVMK